MLNKWGNPVTVVANKANGTFEVKFNEKGFESNLAVVGGSATTLISKDGTPLGQEAAITKVGAKQTATVTIAAMRRP